MASDITLHVELMGQDRDLLERTCENLEWYRKHLQEQAQVQQAEQEQAQVQQAEQEQAQKRGGSWETKEKLSQPLSAEDQALLMQVEQEAQRLKVDKQQRVGE